MLCGIILSTVPSLGDAWRCTELKNLDNYFIAAFPLILILCWARPSGIQPDMSISVIIIIRIYVTSKLFDRVISFSVGHLRLEMIEKFLHHGIIQAIPFP